jgi:radical SAM superfamily enzyme YgiQ (UPF0313 family)
MPNEHGVMEFSRGCIFKCKFCNFPVLGVKGDYTRSQESVYEQLMFNYDNYGIQDYGISDETFNDRSDKITKFADVVEKLPWKPYFNSFIRPDLLVARPNDKEELLRLGLYAHFYGVESFNPNTAKYIGKGMAPEKLKQGLLDVKDYFKKHVGFKYRAQISLITGLPHETLDTLEETKQWINKHWLDQVITAQPLIIHKLGEPRPSDLDESYESMGYEEIPFDSKSYLHALNIKESSEQVNDISIYRNTDAYQGIIWKNSHMNFYDAISFAGKLNGLYKKSSINLNKVDPLFLPQVYSDSLGNVLTTDEKLKLIGNKVLVAHENARVFIKSYIEKKLSI